MASDPRIPVAPRPPSAAAPASGNPVINALRKAAQATGTKFEQLLATAKIESDLNPNLTMRSSSATGLFQFIDQTWLETMKSAGRSLGFGKYADGIQQTRSGRYVVQDPALRSEIMRLRKDPAANAAMGGAFTRQNEAQVSKRIGRQPTEGELYVAHFFGASTGSKVINMAATHPNANAPALFPAAARANRPIFYDRQGNARSISGVYSELVRRYQVARASATPGLAPAFAEAAPVPPAPIPSVSGTATATAGITNNVVLANAAAPANPPLLPVRGDPDMFHSLFQVGFAAGDRREAVSPAVAQLWSGGGGATQPSAQSAAPASPTQGDGSPLDLFQERAPDVRGLFEGSA